MSIRKVLKMGHPMLRQVAAEVTGFDTPELHALVEDMFDTMWANDGAGIAAPQIGVSLRVVVFDVSNNPRYPEAEVVPRTVLINPLIEVIDAATDSDWEGCLSVPGMRGLVPRHRRIRYTGHTETGEPIDRVVEGFHARVVQHECDHLDGILYPQRIEDISDLGFIEELVAAGRLPATIDR